MPLLPVPLLWPLSLVTLLTILRLMLPLVTVPGDFWTRLGAKPKALVSSTPYHQEPWFMVGGRSKRGRRTPCAPAWHPSSGCGASSLAVP